MKKCLLLFFILLQFNLVSIGQTYLMQRGNLTSEISGSGTSITSLSDDNYSDPIDLGFNFVFFGNTYTNLYVASNGYVSFNTGYANFNFSVLSNEAPNNFISFAGGDLNCSIGTPDINYFTTGIAPNRVFVLNFKNVAHFNDNTNLSSVQLQLYEGSNEIQMHISNLEATGGNGRTVGVENIDGSIGVTELSLNNNTTINITNEMIKFVEIPPLPTCPNNISVSSTVGSSCSDLSTTLTASVSPSENFDYQWYKGTIIIAGANSSTYNTIIAGNYFVKISSSNCQLNSTSVNVSEIPVKRIIGSNCVGSTLTACGYGATSIQWNKDGVPISGETSSTFVPSQQGNYSITASTPDQVWTSYPTSLALSSNFHFQDANVGWIVNQSGNIIYKTTNGGTSWTQQIDITAITSHLITKILSLSSSVVIAIGSEGLLLRSINGGTNWSIVSDGIYNSLNDLSFIDSSTGWIAGNMGTLLKTTDGGATWSQINGISEDISAVRFKNATIGYSITRDPNTTEYLLNKTIDGGNNWVGLVTAINSYSWERFLSNNIPVLYISQSLNLGYISGNVSYITLYDIGGGIFQEIQELSGGLLDIDLGFSNLGGYFSTYDEGFQDIEFISTTEGWGVAFGLLRKTVDGGNSFTNETIQGAGNLSSLFNIQILPSGTVGWGYGDGNKYLKMAMGTVSESSPAITIINKPQAPTITATANINQLCPGQLIEVSSSCSGTTDWSNGQVGSNFLHTYISNTSITATCSFAGCPSLASNPINLNGYFSTLLLTENATNGSQSAIESIQSVQKINSEINTNYFAGHNISLNNGFEAKAGSVFKAEIKNSVCINNDDLVLDIPFFNNANDFSGNVRSGSVYAATLTTGRKGSPNSAYSFNGNNNSISFGNWFNLQEFSISLWVNASSTQANPYAILIDNNYNGSRSWLSQQNNSSNNNYDFGVNGTPSGGAVNFNLTPNTWTHVVFVKGNGFVKVYTNNVLVNTAAHNGNISYDGTQNLIIGAWWASGSFTRFWNGKMDDLKIYNRAITNDEVTLLFNE